jgi:hypothetical protein
MPRLARMLVAALTSGALVACGGSGNSTPSTFLAIAGEYAGPVVDSVAGTESGDIVLAQHGRNAGGAMTLTQGNTTSVESVTLVLSGSSLTGSAVMDVNGSACTFSVNGTYASGAITATYTGVSGCTHTGTWTLTQTCVGVPDSEQRRTTALVPAC